MSADVPCPSCGMPLIGALPACETCGLPLTGPTALRLWHLDQDIGALLREREGVLAQLRASGGAAAESPPGLPAPLSGLPASLSGLPASLSGLPASLSGPPAAAPVAPTRPRPQWTGQQVLLSVGALLVLVAAVVFVAVTWTAIGVAGQVAVMAVATVLAGWASVRVARRGLRSTGTALAGLTAALAVVDAWAAHALNLAGLARVADSTYVAWAAAGLAVVFALVSSRDLGLRPYPWASALAAAVVPAAVLVTADANPAVVAGVALLSAVAFVALRRALPGRWRPYRLPLLIVAGIYLAVTWLAAVPTVYEEPLRGQGGWAAAVALLAAAGCAWGARLDRGLRTMDDHPVLALAAVLSAAAVVVGLAYHASPVGLVVVAAAAAALLAYTFFAPRYMAATFMASQPLVPLAVGAQLAAIGALLILLDYADPDGATPHPLPLSVALAAVAVGAAVVAVRQPVLRLAAAACAMGAGVAATAVAANPYGDRWTAGVLVTGAVVAAVVAGWRRTRPEELSLMVVALMAATTSFGFGAAAGAQPLAVVLAVAGVAALAYGVLPHRGYAAILGVVGCSAATWTLFFDAEVDTVEAYSLPLAALSGLVGLVRRHRDPSAPSWLTVGPALTAALLPSALRSVSDEGLTRPLLVLLAGALVLVGGVLLRWQSPVVLGAVALGLVSISQLVILAAGLPRWLSFGTVGLALLILGARYEQRRRNARQAAHWVVALH